MKHDPEQLAAAYLTGQLQALDRRRHEAHLLECESCWQEVALGRRGRALAEADRELPPPTLREDIRAAVTAAADLAPDRRLTGRPRILAVAAAIVIAVALLSGVAVLRPWHHTGTPASTADPLTAAVASYRADTLPGIAVPTEPAPDLSSLGLTLVSAGTGSVNGVAVTTYCYRTADGTRINVYRSTSPFTESAEAHELGGTHGESAWTLDSNGVTVICAKGAHSTLLLGSDPTLLHQAAILLNVV